MVVPAIVLHAAVTAAAAAASARALASAASELGTSAAKEAVSELRVIASEGRGGIVIPESGPVPGIPSSRNIPYEQRIDRSESIEALGERLIADNVCPSCKKRCD
jgi:hypothetical protein